MWPNPFLAQRVGEERRKDTLREAERARLVRAAKGAEPAGKASSHSLVSRLRDLARSVVSVSRSRPEPAETRGFAPDSRPAPTEPGKRSRMTWLTFNVLTFK